MERMSAGQAAKICHRVRRLDEIYLAADAAQQAWLDAAKRGEGELVFELYQDYQRKAALYRRLVKVGP